MFFRNKYRRPATWPGDIRVFMLRGFGDIEEVMYSDHTMRQKGHLLWTTPCQTLWYIYFPKETLNGTLFEWTWTYTQFKLDTEMKYYDFLFNVYKSAFVLDILLRMPSRPRFYEEWFGAKPVHVYKTDVLIHMDTAQALLRGEVNVRDLPTIQDWIDLGAFELRDIRDDYPRKNEGSSDWDMGANFVNLREVVGCDNDVAVRKKSLQLDTRATKQV